MASNIVIPAAASSSGVGFLAPLAATWLRSSSARCFCFSSSSSALAALAWPRAASSSASRAPRAPRFRFFRFFFPSSLPRRARLLALARAHSPASQATPSAGVMARFSPACHGTVSCFSQLPLRYQYGTWSSPLSFAGAPASIRASFDFSIIAFISNRICSSGGTISSSIEAWAKAASRSLRRIAVSASSATSRASSKAHRPSPLPPFSGAAEPSALSARSTLSISRSLSLPRALGRAAAVSRASPMTAPC
mmetsp:Transcript_32628/g.73673  ORF Transcript_32628/g.73673 Transcript_32628/m.73673 type:complete len:251 (-) Transcript_32628:604-1356(-)